MQPRNKAFVDTQQQGAPAEQRLPVRVVCLCGAPRSGTTWLQRLLASSPAVATGQESFLFSQYLVPELRAFRWGVDRRERGALGLGAYFTEQEFLEMLQQHAATILDRMIRKAMRDKPQAVIFVDKTPLAALMTHEIHSILPDVRFLMMTRDPLDVVASWRRSSRTWAPWMSTRRVGSVARTVGEYLAAVERARRNLTDDEVMVVSYEALFDDPAHWLSKTFRFLGIDQSGFDLNTMIGTNSVDGIRAGEAYAIPLWGVPAERGIDHVIEPEGFIGPARPGGGAASLSPVARWRIHRIVRAEVSRDISPRGLTSDGE